MSINNSANSTTLLNGKYFYLNNSTLICSSLNFNKSEKVTDNVIGYSVDTDSDNNLNVITFDNNSNITYLKFLDGDLNKLITKEKMSGAKSICYVKFFSGRGNIQNMFILTKNTQRSELYQLINYRQTKNGWRGHRIIDLLYFRKEEPTVKIDMDNNDNFHIIYKEYTSGIFKLKYKTFLSKYNKWSNREVLVKSKYDLNNILMLCDSENNINVSWSSLSDKDIEVKFIKRDLNPYKVTRWVETTSFPFIKNLTNPILLEVNDKLRYGWKQNDTYNYIDTKHNKNSWFKKTSFKLMGYHLSPATYIPDKKAYLNNTKIPNTYLYFNNNDYKLLGLDELGAEKQSSSNLLKPAPLVLTPPSPVKKQSLKKPSIRLDSHPLEKSDILTDFKIL